VLDSVRLRDPGVRAARSTGEAGRAQAAQAWALVLPHVTLSAGFTRSDDPALLFSQKLWQGRFAPDDFAVDRLNQPEPQSALQWTVAVDQPLWNGGRELTAPGLAARQNRAATAAERAQVADRLLAAVDAYVGALEARENARAAEQALVAARAMRAAAIERFRRGQVSELDTLRAAARDGEARVRELGARHRSAIALEQLSRLVHEEVTAESLAPLEEIPAVPEQPGSERGELAAVREGAAAAGTEARTAALRLLPSLNSRFAVTGYRPYATGAFERRWLVAVSADVPLFDGGQRWNEWRAARARATAARATAQTLKRDLALDLAAARAEEAVARERRDAARAGRMAAEEALRLAGERYRAGLLPLTELLATDAEASGARAAEVEASSATTLAHYRLLHARGELR
jgi:outer membrane protein